MIAKLTGIIDGIFEDYLIIDVGGVGYKVHATSRSLAKLVPQQPSSLLIETVVREDAFLLYGFENAEEQYWFSMLTNYVQGVGAKVALSILSVLSPHELMLAIASGDKASLGRANGVGPKLALRLVTELKDKVKSISIAPAEGANKSKGKQPAPDTAMNETISALVNLGYPRLTAMDVTATLLRENPEYDTETLIKMSLKKLSQK